MANVRRLKRRVRKAKAFRHAVSSFAMEMEEPLRHATQFVRAILMAHRPEDDEIDALSFVAGEAVLRLEDCETALHGLFDALDPARAARRADQRPLRSA